MLKFSVWLLTYLILSNAVLQNGNTLNLVGISITNTATGTNPWTLSSRLSSKYLRVLCKLLSSLKRF